MLNKSIFATLILVLEFASLAPAYQDDDVKQDVLSGLTVGFSQVGAESDWRTAETNSIVTEAKKRGVTLKFANAQQKQDKQISAITGFINQKVDAIILAPKVETGWDRVLQKAKRAKIPVFLVDRGIKTEDETLYVTLIASDFIEEGKMAATWLTKKMNGKANIVELRGQEGASPAIDRKKGFEEGIKTQTGMTIIKSQAADWTTAKGKEVMEAFLRADRDRIQAVYAHNDNMAFGAIQAIEEAGLKPGKDIIIISVDGVKDAFTKMVEGKLNATVECNPLLGPVVFDAIVKHRAGTKVKKFIKQDDRVYDQSNAADVIDSRKY